MEFLRAFLEQQPLLSMFLVIGLGYAIGQVNIRGFSNVFDEAHTSCPEQPIAKGSRLMINHDVTTLQSRAGVGRTDS
jgi:hypothetical protein